MIPPRFWSLFKGSKLTLLLIVVFSINSKAQEATLSIDAILDSVEVYIDTDEKYLAKFNVRALKDAQLNNYQRYRMQQILKRLSRNEVGVNYEFIDFRPDFPSQKPWNSISTEYMRYFGASSVAGRVTYSNRQSGEGVLYELESYPVFSKKLYGNALVSFSEGGFYQKYGASASLFRALNYGFEAEGGVRYLSYEQEDFTSITLGLTKYLGPFYLNGRAFLGPKTQTNFIQNYQLTTRYYFSNGADFAFLRIGTGISPDDVNRFSQVVKNPSLKAYFATVGFRKWYNNLMIGGGTGYLIEEISPTRTGGQLSLNAQVRYRF